MMGPMTVGEQTPDPAIASSEQSKESPSVHSTAESAAVMARAQAVTPGVGR